MKHSGIIFVFLIVTVHTVFSANSLPDKSDVLTVLNQVNNYWQRTNSRSGNAFWHTSAYHTGNIEAWKITGNSEYLTYSKKWAEANQWKGAKSNDRASWRYTYGETDNHVLFGDWQICFQTYIDLYEVYGDPGMVARAIEVMEYQMQTSANDYWWWADGLYMVMPVMTKLYRITGNELYLEKLHEYFSYAKSIMYDDETGLFFRDAKYVYPQHKSYNGKKDFWARGDGWVFAGLAKVLQDLPSDYPDRKDYISIFRKMAETLAAAQQSEGYWTRSLLDPEHAPGYETSGTAFFTYGFLWGIRNGILDKDTYIPVALSAWNYLSTTALQQSGQVGYVQPIGEKAIPGQVVNERSTADFGVGAYLLACAEMARMTSGPLPFYVHSVIALDKNQIHIRFNRPPHATSAVTTDYYTIENLSITTVSLNSDSTVIVLHCTDLTPGTHTIEFGDIRSASGDTPLKKESRHFDYSETSSVTASSYESGSSNTPEKAIDNDFSTRWSAEGSGEWIQFDLSAVKSVASVDIAYHKGDERISSFSISTSIDRIHFMEVYTGKSGGNTVETETYTFEPCSTRFIRITGRGNNENEWNSITEISIAAENIVNTVRLPVRHKTPQKLSVARKSNGVYILHTSRHTPFETFVRIFSLNGKCYDTRQLHFSNGIAALKDLRLSSGIYYISMRADRVSIAPLLVR